MDETGHHCSYLDALEAMRDMVLVKGPESRLLWANKSFRDYYAMSAGELRDIIDGPQSDPDDTQQYVRDDRRAFELADHLDVPREAITDADGIVRHFHTIKSPIFEDDSVVRVVGVSRLLEDDELIPGVSHVDGKALAAPLRMLTSAFPLSIALTDTLGRVVSASAEWIATFDEVDSDPDTHGLSSIPGLAEPLAQALSHGTSTAIPVQLARGDGLLALDVRLGPWTYNDGSLGGAIVLAIDVTEDAERQAQLEMMVDKRLEAEMSLRQINDDLEHFTHIAAHDLREPARRQLMLTDLILEDHGDDLADDVRQQLERLRGQSQKMLAMITGFRELSGLMGPTAQLREIDLPSVIDEVVTEALPDELRDEVTISLPESIRGYPTLVSALFKNLLENAVAHGARPLDLRVDHEVDDGLITFSVSNEWPGDATLVDGARLFQPFVREHSTSEGSGLGMSICKRVVERHGGKIWLEPDDRFDVRFTLGERS